LRDNKGAALIAAGTLAVLVSFAWGYGYDRDELYFLAAGHHLDWAYADQGPVTPLIARAMSQIAPDSLVVLRLPSALAAGLTVLVTGLLAREFGGRRRAAAIAAACAAVASLVLFTGHILSTSTFDLLTWTLLVWLAVRAIRTGSDRLWIIAGVVLGIGMLNKPLPAFLAAGMLAGVLIAGPRRLLRNPYVWVGAAIAVVMWLPWILWQADHGWPQIDVSRSIAAGNSKSSEPWWAIVPFQFLLVSPLLAPVWIAGLLRLFRDPGLRDVRFLGWTWVVLAVVFMASGGKPYYLGGLLPALLGAGAAPVDAWLDRGRETVRRALLGVAIAASAAVSFVVCLPILPAKDADIAIAMNGDVGEMIGWPELARAVAGVEQRLPGTPDRVVVLTRNYGEAGAIDRYGPAFGLPGAYSGHNAYWEWGRPPDGARPLIAIGFDAADADRWFRGCSLATRVENEAGIDNDESGAPILACWGPREPWSREWPALRHLG